MLGGRGDDTFDKANTDRGVQLRFDTLDVAATEGRNAVVLAGQYRIVRKIGEDNDKLFWREK